MSNPNKTCFFPEPGDSSSFGCSVVVNKKYLAVGDIGANKVVIYTSDDSGQWSRTREIFPPANLPSYEDGTRFGSRLELDGDILTITASTSNPPNRIASAHLTRIPRIKARYCQWRFLINLKTETEVKLIKPRMEKTTGLVRFNLLRNEKIEQFVLSNMGEASFGRDIKLHENLLLIGSPSYTEPGGAWLLDLDNLEAEPKKIVPENIDFPTVSFGETVALSEQFAAIGHGGRLWYYPLRPYPHIGGPHPFTKTLVRNLRNGSTQIIESFGELSLSGNILAVMLPGSDDREQRPLLEVFRLDEDSVPHLIIRRTNVSSAWVQNGFLVFVKHLIDFRFSQICIEPLP